MAVDAFIYHLSEEVVVDCERLQHSQSNGLVVPGSMCDEKADVVMVIVAIYLR